MRVVAIIQARMGSSRLPGKVLADLVGAPMLERVVARVNAARRVDEVVIATSRAACDDAIAAAAAGMATRVYRGSELDVLERYVGAARGADAEVIVRITADCPLIDPEVVDRVIDALAPNVDYASNTHRRTFPRGLDVEALHRDTLERIGRIARSAAAREHVTAFVLEQQQLFVTRDVVAERDDSDLRWTVDTPEDLELARVLYELGDLDLVHRPYTELVALMRRRPELACLNAHVVQKPVARAS